MTSKNKIWYVHDNGGNPFKVVIRNSNVKIYLKINDEREFEKNHKFEFEADEIFIGKSKKNEMTIFSGGYGKQFDGNSILLKLYNGRYVYIGWEIYSFLPLAPIINYNSPVGNNDVPYPYAIDEMGNIYLTTENVILIKKYMDESIYASIIKLDKPYDYYYDLRGKFNLGQKYTKYYVDNNPHNINSSTPMELELVKKKYGKNVHIITDGKKITMNKNNWGKMMNSLHSSKIIKKMNAKLIQKRL